MTTQAWKPGTGPSLLRSVLSLRRHPAPLAAVLWDMDGLLVDSEPLWTIAESELFDMWGVEFTAVTKAAVIGTRLDRAVPALIAIAGPAAAGANPAAVADTLLRRMVELLEGGVRLRPGAEVLFREIAAAGVPQALVSSSYRVLVDAVLAGLGEHPFAVSVAGDEVARGKPAPEPYETAMEKLKVAPGGCVVLEDSAAGARSGAAAGARVVYCPSVAPCEQIDPSWRPVASLLDVSVAGLRGWATDRR